MWWSSFFECWVCFFVCFFKNEQCVVFLKTFIYLFKKFSMYYVMLLLLSCFSRVWLLVAPWTAAHQAPPSMGFSRQEYWSGLPLPSPPWHLTNFWMKKQIIEWMNQLTVSQCCQWISWVRCLSTLFCFISFSCTGLLMLTQAEYRT